LLNLFEHIEKNISLGIIRYNKKLQKRFKLTIKDYKYYSEYIEIELKYADNEYGKFINIPDKEKEYYHIYFDNSKEEIHRNYLKENEKINKIKIIIDK